ncbi:MAG: hypothetical protein IJT73_06490 [Selenomonadaceae bacterium]|nr:hypothetical protein [Selenomonadaceae bacterium]
MASSATVKLRFGFADDTDRPFELGGFDSDAAVVNATTLKTRVKALDPATFAGKFISEGGATCTGITAATISKVTETEINLKASE